jgi:hypothetical protein
MPEERRRNPRVAVDVPARITIEGQTTEGRVRDICRDAALLFADRSCPLGTSVSVEADLPRVAGSVSFSGSVVRLADGEDGHHGMAILFDGLSPQALMRIELFVSDQS